MSIGLDVLNRLEAAGCAIESDGRQLHLSGAKPPTAVLAELGRNKSEVRAAWCQREWQRYTQEQNSNWMRDPRPDLAQDSNRWEVLLAMAHADHGCDEFWWVLQGIRCLGARLALVDGRLTIQRGEISSKEYAEIKAEYLAPCVNDVVAMLDRTTEVLKLGGDDHGNESASGLQATGQPVVRQDQQSLFSIRNY